MVAYNHISTYPFYTFLDIKNSSPQPWPLIHKCTERGKLDWLYMIWTNLIIDSVSSIGWQCGEEE